MSFKVFTMSLLAQLLVVVPIVAYLAWRLRRREQEQFADQVSIMMQQRVQTAVVQAFTAHLKRQPTAAELKGISQEMLAKLQGMQLSKSDLENMALGALKKRGITA